MFPPTYKANSQASLLCILVLVVSHFLDDDFFFTIGLITNWPSLHGTWLSYSRLVFPDDQSFELNRNAIKYVFLNVKPDNIQLDNS